MSNKYKKINNKGFTLIEILIAIAVMSVITITFMSILNNTFSMTDEKAYEAFKKGIIKQVNNYIIECDNNLISCQNDYTWQKKGNIETTSFKLEVMKKYSYFNELNYKNPMNNQDISNCLIINVIKDNYSIIDVIIDDNNCD